jgi:RNA polymerase sigma-70 factor (ECF subfamily)
VSAAQWDEAALVRRCNDGSEAAFAELVRRHRPRLFTLAYRLTNERESAEDVVQETFVAAFRALDRFEPRPSVSAWLNTILVRLAARTASRAAARPRTSLDAMLVLDAGVDGLALIAGAVPPVDPALAAEAAELRRELALAIASLPFCYRAAVVTRYVLGLEYAEAASTLDLGLNTYKSHLLRGTQMLRTRLADAVPERGETVSQALESGLVRAGRSAQVRAAASLPLTAGSVGPR